MNKLLNKVIENGTEYLFQDHRIPDGDINYQETLTFDYTEDDAISGINGSAFAIPDVDSWKKYSEDNNSIGNGYYIGKNNSSVNDSIILGDNNVSNTNKPTKRTLSARETNIVLGNDNSAGHYNSIMLGIDNKTIKTAPNINDDGFTITIGNANTAVRNYDIAIGHSAYASGGDNIAINGSAVGYRNLVYNNSKIYTPSQSPYNNGEHVGNIILNESFVLGECLYNNNIFKSNIVITRSAYNTDVADNNICNSYITGVLSSTVSRNNIENSTLLTFGNVACNDILDSYIDGRLTKENKETNSYLIYGILPSQGIYHNNIKNCALSGDLLYNDLFGTVGGNIQNSISHSVLDRNNLGYTSTIVDNVTKWVITGNIIPISEGNPTSDYGSITNAYLENVTGVFNLGDNQIYNTLYSECIGEGNILSGKRSSCSNRNNSIIGTKNQLYLENANANAVMGEKNLMSGTLFVRNKIHGTNNTILGYNVINNTIFGTENVMSGTTDYTVIYGTRNVASGNTYKSFIFGENNLTPAVSPHTHPNSYSLIIGDNNNTYGCHTVAIGSHITAGSAYSYGFGEGLQANLGQVVIGQFNIALPGADAKQNFFVPAKNRTGALFIVGNGAFDVERLSVDGRGTSRYGITSQSNAMVVSANGTVSANNFAIPEGNIYDLISAMSATIITLNARIAALEKNKPSSDDSGSGSGEYSSGSGEYSSGSGEYSSGSGETDDEDDYFINNINAEFEADAEYYTDYYKSMWPRFNKELVESMNQVSSQEDYNIWTLEHPEESTFINYIYECCNFNYIHNSLLTTINTDSEEYTREANASYPTPAYAKYQTIVNRAMSKISYYRGIYN